MTVGLYGVVTVAWLLLLAVAPAAVYLGFDGGVEALGRLAVLLGVVAIWQSVFRRAFGQAPSPATFIGALAIALFAPPAAALWQLALALSFGAVIGEMLFGGWGRNFLNSGCVALAFLSLSIPDAPFVPAGPILALALLPGALLLMLCGIVSVSIPVAFAAVLAASAVGAGPALPFTEAAGSLVFAAIFFAADPIASPTETSARWAHGALAGGLTVLFAGATALPGAAVYACLLAAIFAPLLDQVALAARMGLRRWRRVVG